jgi:hypothetical protein
VFLARRFLLQQQFQPLGVRKAYLVLVAMYFLLLLARLVIQELAKEAVAAVVEMLKIKQPHALAALAAQASS